MNRKRVNRCQRFVMLILLLYVLIPHMLFPVSAAGAADVAEAAALGMVNGDADGCFHPEELLTRQQTAAMLHRTAVAVCSAQLQQMQYDTPFGELVSWAK